MMGQNDLQPPPARTRHIDGVTWRYSITGEGASCLLVLPGAVGGADVGLRLQPFLENHRILTLTYPRVEDLKTLMRGIDEIVTAEGLEQFDLFGASFGGMVAQYYVHRAPAGVRYLILQGTGVATPHRASTNERFLKVAGLIPMGVFRWLLRRVTRLMLRKIEGHERGVWIAYYDQEIAALSKTDLVCRYRLAIDFDRNHRFGSRDLAGHSIPVLILEGEEDRVSKGQQRDQLKALFPRARVHTFSGVGHGMSLLRPQEWGQVIQDFLDSPGA